MLADVIGILRCLECPWFVVGGWAISLFVGYQFRPHSDVDMGIFRIDQLTLRKFLSDWQVYKVSHGQFTVWRQNEFLVPPVFEIQATSPNRRVEFLLHDICQEKWTFRRNAAVTLPARQLCRKAQPGLNFVCPEVALLFKAQNPSETDSLDFQMARGALSRSQKEWLAEAIERCYPGHDWIQMLK